MQILNRNGKYKSSGKILMIPTGEIQPNPEQPRREFSYEKLLELAQSISENGLLNPISVTLINDKPVLVAGERRLRAAKIVGISVIPCIIVQAEGPKGALLSLIENLQREDMNCFEEAEGIQRLISVYGLTQEETANRLGCAQSTVANRLRLLRLDEDERQIILQADLTERHARALLRLSDKELRGFVLQRICEEKLNVAQTEQAIEDLLMQSNTEEDVKNIGHRKVTPLIRDVRLFLNTVNHAVDTMRRSGIDASTQKTETDDYIDYVVHIPKSVSVEHKHSIA